MHNVMTYSPVPAVLQSPESLDTLLRIYQRLLATGTAHLPADHSAALWAVHGGFLSRRFLSATTTEISTNAPEVLRQWLNSVWCPLHQAAVENDAEAFFCAEVNLLKTELQKTDLSSPDSAGCMAWASLTGLDRLPFLPESHRPYPFRMALTVSRHLAAPGWPGETRRTLAEWRAVLFPAALTLKEPEISPPAGWTRFSAVQSASSPAPDVRPGSAMKGCAGFSPLILQKRSKSMFRFSQRQPSGVIHAGRQRFFFIHNLSFYLMDMDALSARSDRGRQTYRSERVQAVKGMIPPAAVRPAPLCRFLRACGAARARHTVLYREARHV